MTPRFRFLLLSACVLGAAFVWFSYGKSGMLGAPLTPERSRKVSLSPPISSTVAASAPLSPCHGPQSLKIGQVDSAFGVSPDAFSSAVKAAVAEWHDATGRAWFLVGNSGDITVNFLYDGRQETLDKQRREREDLRNKAGTLRGQQRAVSEEGSQFSAVLKRWEVKRKQFAEEMAAYYKRLQDISESGIRDDETISELEITRRELATVNQELEGERLELVQQFELRNQTAGDISTQREALLNQLESFRKRYPPQIFTEGQHLKGGPIHEINIYIYESPEELHLALLHELGHAIGLGHLTSDGAVMNPLRELGKGDFHLNAADVEAAYNFCRGSNSMPAAEKNTH